MSYQVIKHCKALKPMCFIEGSHLKTSPTIHETFSRSSERGGQMHLVIGLGAALAALLFFLWLVEEVLEGDTQAFDDNLRTLIHQYASPSLTTVMQLFSFLGSLACLSGLSTLATLYLAVLKRWRDLTHLAIIMIGSLILENGLKIGFHRARPVSFFGTPTPPTYSFPSGHALLSLCFYGATAYLMTRRFTSNKTRILLLLITALLIGLIGFSRIYLGVHYPSDVIAGYLVATIWVMCVALADHFYRRAAHRRPS